MREYCGDIHFVCLEAEKLAKKQFSFKVFSIATWSLFSNSSIHSRYLFVMSCICDGSITIMWSLNLFRNGFPLPCRRVKHQSCQDIRV